MRYQFDLTISRVGMYIPFKTGISVIFSRGPKRQETKKRPEIGVEVNTVDFNETLSLLSTIYKNKTNGTFVERYVITYYH